jgi:hypothetical protein
MATFVFCISVILFYLAIAICDMYFPSIFNRKGWKAWKSCYYSEIPVLKHSVFDNYRFEFPNTGYGVYVFNARNKEYARTCVFELGGDEPIVFSSYYRLHSKKMLDKLEKFI